MPVNTSTKLIVVRRKLSSAAALTATVATLGKVFRRAYSVSAIAGSTASCARSPSERHMSWLVVR